MEPATIPAAPSTASNGAGGLDPQVVALAKAVRQVESGGNPTAQGQSGEYGAYQYIPATWATQSKAAGVNVPLDQATLQQQNQVWYTWAKAQKDAGKNVGQIASMQNAGEGDPDAYLNGNSGVNGSGVPYDTKAYAQKVATLYQQYKTQGQQVDAAAPIGNTGGYQAPVPPSGISQGAPQIGGGYPAPVAPEASSATGNAAPPAGPTTTGGEIADLAKKAGNFLFPIAGDLYNDVTGQSQKTALQQVGDAGLSALPFIPGLGEAGEAARGAEAVGEGAEVAAKGTGLASKLLGSSVAKNAAVGYGAGVAANLGAGQGVGQALTPQLSNIGGAVLGGGSAAILNKLGASGAEDSVINKMRTAYEDALGATKTGVKASSKVAARGAESPADFLANAGLPPETAEVNGRQIFTTGPDSQTYKAIQGRTQTLTALRDNLIDTADTTDLGGGMMLADQKGSSLDTLHEAALAQIEKQFVGTERTSASKYINDEFQALKEQYGGSDVSLKDLNTVKKYFQDTNYDATRPSVVTKANKLVGSLARQQVEGDAAKADIPGIGELNKIIQQHLDFLDTASGKGILSKLNGQVVKGGRVGVHVKEVLGGVAGGIASSALGGGPVGDIAGTFAGGYAGNVLARLLQKSAVGGPGFAAKVGKIAQEDPALITQLVKILEEKGVKTEGLVSPRLVPKPRKATGLIPSLLTKGAIRAGAAI